MTKGKLKTVYLEVYLETSSLSLIMFSYSAVNRPDDQEKIKINKTINHGPRLTLGQILKQKRAQQAEKSTPDFSKILTGPSSGITDDTITQKISQSIDSLECSKQMSVHSTNIDLDGASTAESIHLTEPDCEKSSWMMRNTDIVYPLVDKAKFTTVNSRSIVAQDNGTAPVEYTQIKYNVNISYGILLFNEFGELLTLRRPHSYAFASMFLILINPPKNRTINIYTEMIREFTEEEYELMKNHWSGDGLDYLIDDYLSKLVLQLRKVREQFQRKFEINYEKMKFEWKQIVNSFCIDQVQRDRPARIHDFPKGRKPHNDSKTREEIIHNKFKQETCHNLPNDIVYGQWIKVSYESTDGAWYNFELLSAKCKRFELKLPITQWILPENLQVIEKVHKAVKKAWVSVAKK